MLYMYAWVVAIAPVLEMERLMIMVSHLSPVSFIHKGLLHHIGHVLQDMAMRVRGRVRGRVRVGVRVRVRPCPSGYGHDWEQDRCRRPIAITTSQQPCLYPQA